MENIYKQLSNFRLSYSIDSFKKLHNVDFLNDKKTVLFDKFKYYNTLDKVRVYIPKLLFWILEKQPAHNFYISKTSIVKTNKNNLYLSIEIDFILENYKNIPFTIGEIKSFTNAKFLPFNKLNNQEHVGDFLYSHFGFLKILSERHVLEEIEKNPEFRFYIDFFENKNTIILKKS